MSPADVDDSAGAALPLEGVRVVDFTHFVAGPWCTMLLADLGAEVVKIEPPRAGEIGRRMGAVYQGPHSAIYLAFNRNKRSVELDLKQPEGRAAAHRLVTAADVVVQNFRPSVAPKLQMDATRIRGQNPELVYCAISAFGQTGPYAGRPGNDPIVQALSGAMLLGRAQGERPLRMAVSLPDFAAGVIAALSISSALVRSMSPCNHCIAKNSGGPISAAGSNWRNLPRRGAGWSGGITTITPTSAAAAANSPAPRCIATEISASPSAADRPLVT